MITKPPSLGRSLDLYLEGKYRESAIESDRYWAIRLPELIEKYMKEFTAA